MNVKRGDSINNMDKIENGIVCPNGIITVAQLTKAGLHRGYLHNFVESGELYRFGRGLYVQSSAWEDDFYLLQQKYSRGIYSHDTALYLLGYSDRTPAKYTMTFPKGYNALSLKQETLIVKRAIPENYDFGIIEIQSPSGNPIRVYDLERTLCDILRGSGSDIQIVGAAMKRYAAIQRQRHSQIDAVRRAASSETKGSALHRDFIMITKNPMQLKAYIKKKATEKHILHSL